MTERMVGGVTFERGGATFALWSDGAEAVDLCLFDPTGFHETDRLRLDGGPDGNWNIHRPGIEPGQLYGYRVHGPYRPLDGHRFNPHKLLVDPYARALSGRIAWGDETYGFRGADDLSFDDRDSAPFVPKSVALPLAPVPDTRPRRPWRDTVIYEAHVKGLTWLHPDIPPAERGTYAALGHPAIVTHLTRLGVTALELLPIHAFADDRFLEMRGLTNYWGYSSLAFFAPTQRYGGGRGRDGLKEAVAALHAAGIEVILDVVYNHTAELEETGPTLSLRGIDNRTYYKPEPGQWRRSWNITGCGNTLNVAHPAVRRLVLDSLRFWVTEYGIDGFRFDLGTVLARDPLDFDTDAPFLQALAADPLLSDVKLIAEPWDIGQNGYHLGGFPAGWSEWNDRARDASRRFWRGDRGTLPDLAKALTGSRETFARTGRGPFASINYAASHDGFTLRDAVSYEEKHNEANREGNRDGHNENHTWHCGVEGETDDPTIGALRRRQVRNLLATLFVSQGVPMLLAGDELSRTQAGNNNAYCQDNETTWLDWSAGAAFDPDLPAFVAALTALRKAHPALRRDEWLVGEGSGGGPPDIRWLSPEGRDMTAAEWDEPGRQVLGFALGAGDGEGPPILVLLNAGPEDATVRLPPGELERWAIVLRTDRPDGRPGHDAATAKGSGTFILASRSVVLLKHLIPG